VWDTRDYFPHTSLPIRNCAQRSSAPDDTLTTSHIFRIIFFYLTNPVFTLATRTDDLRVASIWSISPLAHSYVGGKRKLMRAETKFTMDSNTNSICNYCQGQAFDKGRCLSCGASSWRIRNAFTWILPKQQPGNQNPAASETGSTGFSLFVDAVETTIRLVEKVVSTAITIVKYKFILLFSILAIGVATDSKFRSKEQNNNNVSVSEFRSQPAVGVDKIASRSGKRFLPPPMKPPSQPNFDDQQPVPFSIAKTTWGSHFNPGNLVPDKGFLAFYFDRSRPAEQIYPVQVSDINIQYNGADFRGIHSNNFGAYWVGKITLQERQRIEVITDEGWNDFRVIIDGSVVHEHSRGSDPAIASKLATAQRSTHRDSDEGTVVLQEAVSKQYPKSKAGNPLVVLSAGDHLIEIELLNNWHTTEFKARFKKVRLY